MIADLRSSGLDQSLTTYSVRGDTSSIRRAAHRSPFTYTQPVVLLTDTDLIEYYCTENEKDVRHFK